MMSIGLIDGDSGSIEIDGDSGSIGIDGDSGSIGLIDDDSGSIGVAGAILGLVIVALMGLVVWYGNSLGALSRTREVADNAARAGAQEVDVDHLLATGELRLDPDAAALAAADLIAVDGATELVAVSVEGETVTVTVAQSVASVLGAGEPRVFTATESADAIRGVSEVIE